MSINRVFQRHPEKQDMRQQVKLQVLPNCSLVLAHNTVKTELLKFSNLVIYSRIRIPWKALMKKDFQAA